MTCVFLAIALIFERYLGKKHLMDLPFQPLHLTVGPVLVGWVESFPRRMKPTITLEA
jgi:hypothetical protein